MLKNPYFQIVTLVAQVAIPASFPYSLISGIAFEYHPENKGIRERLIGVASTLLLRGLGKIRAVPKVFLNANYADYANLRKFYIDYNQQYTKLIYALICANLRNSRNSRNSRSSKTAVALKASIHVCNRLKHIINSYVKVLRFTHSTPSPSGGVDCFCYN